MANSKDVSLMCSILVLAAISMPQAHCRVLRPNDAKLIEETCNKTPYPQNCVEFLKGDPRSFAADVRGLALIMVNVIQSKANYALHKISQLLLRGGGDKKALTSCAGEYKAILEGDVPQAIQALKYGDPKFAEDGAADSSVEATSCEKNFSGKSPLTYDNNGMRIAADVARAIIRLLL